MTSSAHRQDPVAVADLAHALPVALGRRERAAGVLHRLHDHHGDGLGPACWMHRLEILEQERGELGLGLLRRTVVAVRVVDVDDVRHERLEGRLQRGDAVDRERAHGRPVVGDPPRDRLPAALAAGRVVLARELPGRLDGLRAAGDEEDAVQVARRDARRPRRRARSRAGARSSSSCRRAARAAAPRGLADLVAEAVADVDGEEPGERVEVALAVDVLEVAAVAAHDDRDVLAVVAWTCA